LTDSETARNERDERDALPSVVSPTQSIQSQDNFLDSLNAVHSKLPASNRLILSDRKVTEDVRNCDFSNRLLIRLVAKGKTFEHVDFKYTIFESCYLRGCKFNMCDFTGCRFISTNLHNSSFSGCNFEYALFERTLVSDELLDTGCPSRENLTATFARSLRTNFQQIGDVEGANKAIKVELQATEIHLHKVWRSRESYYRNKYRGWTRIRFFARWFKFRAFDILWGNGESVFRVARSAALAVLFIAIGNLMYGLRLMSAGRPIDHSLTIAAALPIFIGTESPDSYSRWVLACIALSRYVLLALFTSTLVKRLNRR
jgi:hypothetical protein